MQDEIERIQQLRADLMKQPDQYRLRLECFSRQTRVGRVKIQLVDHQIRQLELLIATHDRHIQRLRTILSD